VATSVTSDVSGSEHPQTGGVDDFELGQVNDHVAVRSVLHGAQRCTVRSDTPNVEIGPDLHHAGVG
jgi:hypothetical protein